MGSVRLHFVIYQVGSFTNVECLLRASQLGLIYLCYLRSLGAKPQNKNSLEEQEHIFWEGYK
jgi:hypothetical protein